MADGRIRSITAFRSAGSYQPLVLLLLLTALGGCVQSPEPSPPEQIVARLVSLLKDPDPVVRRTAALSLGKIAEPDTAASLRDGLFDPDTLVRQHSAWALGNLGEAAIDPAGLVLVQKLNDPSPAVKSTVAQAIGKIGATQGMVELLGDALEEADPATRRAVVQALGWLESPSAYQMLLDALTDEDAAVRQGAVAALGELGDPHALPALRQRLLKDPDVGVRSEAAFRLGKLGDDALLPMLQFISAKDEDANVRRWAAWAVTALTEGPGNAKS
ncbi:MAG: HEAT repeat domain-containing protein [Nitrospirota bacterium]|nr:HEAT repeat domain-containing protein [Nitrospirota bacterium]